MCRWIWVGVNLLVCGRYTRSAQIVDLGERTDSALYHRIELSWNTQYSELSQVSWFPPWGLGTNSFDSWEHSQFLPSTQRNYASHRGVPARSSSCATAISHGPSCSKNPTARLHKLQFYLRSVTGQGTSVPWTGSRILCSWNPPLVDGVLVLLWWLRRSATAAIRAEGKTHMNILRNS